MTTGRSFARGLAALLGLLLLVVVPPVALVRLVGWPLPTTVPGLDEMAATARGGIDDVLVVKTLAVLAWLCWIQIAVAVMVEVAAVARGRAARRAPVLAGVQVGVGRLVAAAALIVASFGAHRVPAGPVPVARLAAIVAEPVPAAPIAAWDAPAALRAAPVGAEPASESGDAYVVKRNDSWWAIAERTLGNGQRWRDLRAANVGRTMPDGTVVAASTELIRPGWELLVPAGAPQTTGVDGDLDEVEVHRGDNLWVLAERHLEATTGGPASEAEVREHWATVIELNRDRLADPANPSRIYAGQRMRMPPVGREAAPPIAPPQPGPDRAPPVAPSTTLPGPAALPALPDPGPPPTTGTTTTSRSPASMSPSSAVPQQAAPPAPASLDSLSPEDRAGTRAGLLGTASTVLAVGIATALTRHRRRRQLRVPPRAQLPNPPPELDDLRAAVVINGHHDQVARLHGALRDIASELANRRIDARPRMIQVAGSQIEALMSRAVLPAPKPWRADGSGLSWELKGEPLDSDADGIDPIPALVTIGRPEPDTELFVDLEAEGVVSLVGAADEVAGVARSWVLELATSPMASGVSVLVVGEQLTPSPETSERVRLVETWEEAEGCALAWCDQSAALLKARRWANPVEGRMSTASPDELAPLVVVARGVPSERLCPLADAILDQQAAVVLLAVGVELDRGLRAEVSNGSLTIPSLDLAIEAQALPHAVAEQVDELLEDAAHLPAQLTLISEPPHPPLVPPEPEGEEYRDPPFEILIRLLGDISVIGAPKNLKPKQVAVLAYIALHAPVAAERVEDAVWVTPTASRRKRLANTVSETRSVVGAANLPISVDGRYRVGRGLVTDVDLFERRLEHASRQDDVAAVVTLRGALELVAGRVFTYRNVDRMSYVWVDVDNWISIWELKVTDTAEDLVRRCLDLDDTEGAIWAARRGLQACPTHSRLTQLLARAHVAAGDRLAGERVLRSYRAAMEKLELEDDLEDLVEGVDDYPVASADPRAPR
jgi:nucleoid-associated protein YgaU